MKLGLVLMFTALPFCSCAGSGCKLFDDVVEKTISPAVNLTEYTEFLKPYISGPLSKAAAESFKQCFLIQSNETLQNTQLLMDIIYNSASCQKY